jgi:hypothetical protein
MLQFTRIVRNYASVGVDYAKRFTRLTPGDNEKTSPDARWQNLILMPDFYFETETTNGNKIRQFIAGN